MRPPGRAILLHLALCLLPLAVHGQPLARGDGAELGAQAPDMPPAQVPAPPQQPGREAYDALLRRMRDEALQSRASAEREARRMEAQFVAGIQAQENELLRAADADAHERRLLLSIALLLAWAGAVLMLVFLLHIHRQKRRLLLLKAQLATRNVELQHANASRMRLLAAACHDLRQPAHALGMLAEMAVPQGESAALVRKLDGIRRCSAALSEMLVMLMDLTQLEGGRYLPTAEALPLDDLMAEAESQFLPMASRKRLALVVRRCALVVRSDRHLLRRILFNLVSNAVRYSHEGTVTLEAWDDGPDVVLLVGDTGPGIPPGRVADVFGEYVRLDPRGTEGLGIGLAIVRRAADLLGHALVLDSRPGEGTRVTLRLPLVLHHPSAGPAGSAPRGLGQRLAMLEDDRESAEAMADFLRGCGFEVVVGRTASEVLQVIGAQGPDMVVSDLQLGDSPDGLEQVQRLRESWPQLPALLVTGDLSASVAERAARMDVALAYKPLPPQRLLARISEALRRPRAAAAPA